MVDLAPGWRIRCPKCGRSKPLSAVGGVRLGAASVGKRTLAWCRRCRRLRWAAIEKVPPLPQAVPSPEEELAGKVRRLNYILEALGAQWVEQKWDGRMHVRCFRLGDHEVAVHLDGHTVHLEGPADIVKHILSLAQGPRP